MSDNEPVTQALCREIHGKTEEQFCELKLAIKELSNRLYKDNGTISVQTRLDRQAHEIEELKRRGVSEAETQAVACSEFKLGPFAWKLRGKDTTAMFLTLSWRLLALALMAYIVLTLRGVDLGVLKAATVAKENMVLLEQAAQGTVKP